MSKIAKVLFDIQKEVKNLKKDTKNPFFEKSGKPTYVSFETVLDYVHDLCNKHNLLLLQRTQEDEIGAYLETKLILVDDACNESVISRDRVNYR